MGVWIEPGMELIVYVQPLYAKEWRLGPKSCGSVSLWDWGRGKMGMWPSNEPKGKTVPKSKVVVKKRSYPHTTWRDAAAAKETPAKKSEIRRMIAQPKRLKLTDPITVRGPKSGG